MVHAWHFLGSTTLQRLGTLTLREDARRLPTGVLRRYPVLHVGTTGGIVPFMDPGHLLLVGSSVIWRAPTPGSCRAAADSPARIWKPQRSGSSGKKAVTGRGG